MLDGPHQAVVRDIPEPPRAPDEVLVAMDRVGICGSDLAVYAGTRRAKYPLVLGHEGVGRVVDPGSSPYGHDARVVVEPNIPCGTCVICRRGQGHVCPTKRSLGMNAPGVFAELVAVPAEFVHPLPETLTFADAVGIEPLAVALHAFGAGHVAACEPVAVIGCGAEGLLLLRVAATFGARVLALDVRPERLEVARSHGAQQVALVPSAGAATEVAERIAREWCPAVVFEAAGAAAALDLAMQVVAPGGRIVAVGLAANPIRLLPLAFVRRGLTLVGSLIYDHPADFEWAIDVVNQRKIQPSTLVTEVLDGLESLPAALATLAAGESGGKTIVRFSTRREERA